MRLLIIGICMALLLQLLNLLLASPSLGESKSPSPTGSPSYLGVLVCSQPCLLPLFFHRSSHQVSGWNKPWISESPKRPALPGVSSNISNTAAISGMNEEMDGKKLKTNESQGDIILKFLMWKPSQFLPACKFLLAQPTPHCLRCVSLLSYL